MPPLPDGLRHRRRLARPARRGRAPRRPHGIPQTLPDAGPGPPFDGCRGDERARRQYRRHRARGQLARGPAGRPIRPAAVEVEVSTPPVPFTAALCPPAVRCLLIHGWSVDGKADAELLPVLALVTFPDV